LDGEEDGGGDVEGAGDLIVKGKGRGSGMRLAG